MRESKEQYESTLMRKLVIGSAVVGAGLLAGLTVVNLYLGTNNEDYTLVNQDTPSGDPNCILETPKFLLDLSSALDRSVTVIGVFKQTLGCWLESGLAWCMACPSQSATAIDKIVSHHLIEEFAHDVMNYCKGKAIVKTNNTQLWVLPSDPKNATSTQCVSKFVSEGRSVFRSNNMIMGYSLGGPCEPKDSLSPCDSMIAIRNRL